MVVSFNDEGFHVPAHVRDALGAHGYVNHLEVDFKRYVGAQIGIHNPRGEKVGAVSHLRNKEVLFVVGPDRALVERACDGLAPSGRRAVARDRAPHLDDGADGRVGARPRVLAEAVE